MKCDSPADGSVSRRIRRLRRGESGENRSRDAFDSAPEVKQELWGSTAWDSAASRYRHCHCSHCNEKFKHGKKKKKKSLLVIRFQLCHS